MNLDAYFRIQADPVKCSLARLGPRAVTTDEKVCSTSGYASSWRATLLNYPCSQAHSNKRMNASIA